MKEVDHQLMEWNMRYIKRKFKEFGNFWKLIGIGSLWSVLIEGYGGCLKMEVDEVWQKWRPSTVMEKHDFHPLIFKKEKFVLNWKNLII